MGKFMIKIVFEKKEKLKKERKKNLYLFFSFVLIWNSIIHFRLLFSYAFAELENAGDVDAAVRKTNNYPFSKTLRLTVNRWSDFEKLMQVDEEYNPPSIPEYKPKVCISILNYDTIMEDVFIHISFFLCIL